MIESSSLERSDLDRAAQAAHDGDSDPAFTDTQTQRSEPAHGPARSSGRSVDPDADGASRLTMDSPGEPIPAGSAILRAMRIVEMIAQCHTPPQLAEIAKSVQLPKPTVFRILATLEHAGFVMREPVGKRYHCGPRMNGLASSVLLSSPSRGARRAILDELVEQLGETCNLTVANGASILCLDRVEAAWPLKITILAGSSVPMHVSASGKLFLAYLPRRSRDRLVRQMPLVPHTPNSIVEPGQLLDETERIRQQGYSTELEEYLPGICCLAVPVFDSQARVIAALSVHAPVSRLNLEQALELLPEMRSAAAAMAQTFDW